MDSSMETEAAAAPLPFVSDGGPFLRCLFGSLLLADVVFGRPRFLGVAAGAPRPPAAALRLACRMSMLSLRRRVTLSWMAAICEVAADSWWRKDSSSAAALESS